MLRNVCALVMLLAATSASAQSRMTKEAIPRDAPSDIRVLLEQCFAPAASARGDAAKKLGALGTQASAAVPFLVSMLGDDGSYMDSFKVGTMVIHGMSSPARQAAVALGSIGNAAVEPLLRLLQDKKGTNRDKAALALGIAKDSRAVPPLIEALADADARLRAEAAEALGGLKDLRAVPPLIAALREGDEAVSGKAHEALQELTAQRIGKDPAQWQGWWQNQKMLSAAVHVDKTMALPVVTFTYRAPGETERVEKDVSPPDGAMWVALAVRMQSSQKGSCDVPEILLATTDGRSVAAIAIATDPATGFIKFESLPLGVGRGPSAWSVLRGSSGGVRLVTESEAEFHLLFAVPKNAVPATLRLCSLGPAKVPLQKQ